MVVALVVAAASFGATGRAEAQATDQTPSVDSTAAVVRFSAGVYTLDESVGTTTTEIILVARTEPDTGPPLQGFRVRVSSQVHTASPGDDYRSFFTRITFKGRLGGNWVAVGDAYESEVRVEVRIVNDDIDEDDETFGLLLEPVADPGLTIEAAPADPAAASRCTSEGCESLVTIVDDDTRGVIVDQTGPLSVKEGGTADYTLVLDSEPTEEVTVTPALTGIVDADLSVSPALTFTSENWRVPQAVTAEARTDDNPTDGSATVTHAVSGGDYEANGVTAAPVSVVEEDYEADLVYSGDVTIAAEHATALEGIDDLVFTVSRQVAADYGLDVPVTLSAGIIEADQLSHTVTIAAGEVSARLVVATASLDPDAATGDVTAVVGDGVLHHVGDPSSASVRVYVGETLVTVRLSSTEYEFDENVGDIAGMVSVIARTAPNVPAPMTSVQLAVETQQDTAVSPDDYTAPSEMITLPEGSNGAWVPSGDSYMSEVPISVSVVDDNEVEGDEAFRLMLKEPPGLPSTIGLVAADATAPPCDSNGCGATVTIRDDDEPAKPVVVTLVHVPNGTVIPDDSTVGVGATVVDGTTFGEDEKVFFRLLFSDPNGGPAPGGADVELSFDWQHDSPIVPTSGEVSRIVLSLYRVDVWDSSVQILDNDVGSPDSTLTIRITGCERNGCVIGDPSEITVTIADDDGGPATAPPDRPASLWTACPDRGHSAQDTALEVTWKAPDFVGGVPIDHYELRHRTREFADGEVVEGQWQAWPYSVAATSVTVSGLDTDIAYGLQVRAVNANGPGQWSFEGYGRTGYICDILDQLAESP